MSTIIKCFVLALRGTVCPEYQPGCVVDGGQVRCPITGYRASTLQDTCHYQVCPDQDWMALPSTSRYT